MSDQQLCIKLAFGDQLQGFLAVAAIYAAGLEGEILAVHLRQGQGLGPVIKCHHCDHRIGTGTLPCELEGSRLDNEMLSHLSIFKKQSISKNDTQYSHLQNPLSTYNPPRNLIRFLPH